MTYQVVGYSKEEQANVDSIADLVLDGAAFRRTLVTYGDNPDSVASVGSTHTILSEVKERLEIIFEGTISPMKLARQLLRLVSLRQTGRLLVWDLDQGDDYCFGVEQGYITTLSTSRFVRDFAAYLNGEGFEPLDYRGPVVPSEKLRAKLANHVGCDLDTATAIMVGWTVSSSIGILGVSNVQIGWLDDDRATHKWLQLPFGNFVRSAFQASASPDELKMAVSQIQADLVASEHTEWQAWYPSEASTILAAEQKSFQVSDALTVLSQAAEGGGEGGRQYATLLTLIAGGYFNQKTQAPAQQSAVPSAEPKSRKLPNNYYRRLRIESVATAGEIRTAHSDAIRRLDLELEGKTLAPEQHSELRQQLDNAFIILSDRMMRRAYDQARAAKVDFIADGLEAQLLSEHHRKEGERALSRRGYAEAHAHFSLAAEFKSTTEVLLMCSWSNFLNGEQNKTRGNEAITQIQALSSEGELTDLQCLYMGKVARLSEDFVRAKEFLNRAVTLNDKNQEAWGELRLLNTTKSSGVGGARGLVVTADAKDPRAVFLFAFVCLVALYALANIMPSERSEWPIIDASNPTNASAPQNKDFSKMVKGWEAADLREAEEKAISKSREKDVLEELQQARAARPTEAVVFDKTIPNEERVMGNVEYYHLADDTWFWMRRALLAVFALIGIALFGRDDRENIGLQAEFAGLAIIAVPYGLIVGFFTAVPATVTPVGTLLLMGATSALAETLFFFFFVGRCLMSRIQQQPAAALLTTVLFGLHQLTYFATLATEPISVLLSGVLQVTAFAGGAAAFLMYKSRSVVPSLLVLISIQLVLMLKFGNVL